MAAGQHLTARAVCTAMNRVISLPATVAAILTAAATLSSPATADPPKVDEPTILDVGFSAEIFIDVDLNDALAATEVWLSKILERFGKPDFTGTRSLLLTGDDHIVDAVRDGKVDVLALAPLEYVRLRDRLDVLPAFTSVVLGSGTFRDVVLTRKDLNATNFTDLGGLHVVVKRAGRGLITMLWLDALVLRHGGESSGAYFGSVRMAPNVSRAVLPVFFGQADACVVPSSSFDTMVELNPQLGEQLTVIAESPPLTNGIICVRRAFHDRVGAQLEKVIGSMHEDPVGAQMLTLFHVDRLKPFQEGDLDEVEKLVREYEQLRAGVGRHSQSSE